MQKRKKYIKVYFKYSSGDIGVAKFVSLDTVEKLFDSMQLTINGSFTDDKGKLHTNIDTFYGYWT